VTPTSWFFLSVVRIRGGRAGASAVVQLLKGGKVERQVEFTTSLARLRGQLVGTKAVARNVPDWPWVNRLSDMIDAVDRELLRTAHERAKDQEQLFAASDLALRTNPYDAT
jgi:hypothetical protein